MSETNKKLKTLIDNNEDFEWYPTPAEILAAMNKDLRHLFVKDRIAKNCAHNRGEKLFGYSPNYGREKSKVVVYTITSYQCQSCNMDK